VEAANQLAADCRFFHWALEFPEVFDEGGFSCVLGNPPWERIKLQEKEFFADKDEAIATAKNSAARKKLIDKLPQTHPALAQAWEDAKHFADAQGKFVRESRRFPLTATGDINTYAVFAETVRKLIAGNGYAGVILQSGIATDSTNQHFFSDILKSKHLISFFDFVNLEGVFPGIHRTHPHFCAVTLSRRPFETEIELAFYLTRPSHLNDKKRRFNLFSNEISLFNPNTNTISIFRTRTDAELTKKIYQRVPVLENEQTGENPWGISFMRMLDMSNDSDLFFDEPGENRVPLYEGKMLWHFDHRYGTYQGDKIENSTVEQKQKPDYSVTPRYWVNRTEVENRLAGKWDKKWLLGFRDITNATNDRTAIFSLLPPVGVGHTSPLVFLENTNLSTCFFANVNSLIFDFVTRQKLGGTHLTYTSLRQLPVIPPETYTPEDIKYISSRVLELVYTSYDLKPFAQDMGYEGEPFIWNETRRAVLRAKLDAYYAKLYGLTRDELRYILDPADVYGEDFPSETFRVLKNNEVKKYGEYRTQRLVLAAFDRL
jgi:hypothetical protein